VLLEFNLGGNDIVIITTDLLGTNQHKVESETGDFFKLEKIIECKTNTNGDP
jgi:hypothetical protein